MCMMCVARDIYFHRDGGIIVLEGRHLNFFFVEKSKLLSHPQLMTLVIQPPKIITSLISVVLAVFCRTAIISHINKKNLYIQLAFVSTQSIYCLTQHYKPHPSTTTWPSTIGITTTHTHIKHHHHHMISCK